MSDDNYCEAFNVRRAGMCGRPLAEDGTCPRQREHGDEFAGRQ